MAQLRRSGIKLNFPYEAGGWFRRLEIWHSTSKTRLGLAGLLAIGALPESECRCLVQLASLVDEGEVNYDKAREIIEKNATPAARAKAVSDLIGRVLKPPPK